MTPSVSEIVIGIGAYGLPGSASRLPDAPLSAPEWNSVIAGVCEEQLSGFLVRAIEDEQVSVSGPQLQQLRERHDDAMVTTVRLERQLIRAVERLSGGGIEHRVLKGPAVAHLDYRDPSQRPFTDIDLLVPQARFHEAVAMLVGAGYAVHPQSTSSEPGPKQERATRLVADDGCQIDLHRALVNGPFGASIRHDPFFAASSEFELGGRAILALGREERLMNACCEAAVGRRRPRLIALRDIAEMALSGGLDEDRMRQVALGTKGQVLLARGICLAWDALGLADVVALSVWACRYQPDRSGQRALDSYFSQLRMAEPVQSQAAPREIVSRRRVSSFLRVGRQR